MTYLIKRRNENLVCRFIVYSFADLYEALTIIVENLYVQLENMLYRHRVGIPIGTNYVPLNDDLCLYCYERDFMSHLHKSKQYIDMYITIPLYILTIYFPSITLNSNS